MHIIGPLVVIADWLLARDRRFLSYAVVPLLLVYPLLWTGVVLVRGATDGWVPYPFLSPEQGYATVALYVFCIAVLFAGIAFLVLAYVRRGRHRDVQLEIH
ncbi:Pr6Pr family membrane protein [Glutamicibacter sp. M10]|uniref:Pr6Pr family membrane protein n=1 Tax=Glutamicibacter sp. M10 TaxID=3023076 RepID=UPI0021C990A0|nr:Pr6Pr family membrane protein [Glutamicibacter sp. M10]UXN33448.1 Pr6Pr family membrane protein [Glutamicibacter sp. M10]